MRIAYLILCHTDPEHIARLAKKITKDTSDEAFIHVDRKSDITPFEQALSGNVHAHIIKQRLNVYWGGYTAVEATIAIFREALSSGWFDRFVLLQGLEYPIKTNREIHKFFEANMDTEFIRAQDITNCDNKRETHKYYLYWPMDGKHKSLIDWIICGVNSKIFLNLGIIPHFKKKYALDASGGHMAIHQGCAQFGVTHQLAEYIVHFHDENISFNRYFKSLYAPDESYFHTIVYNSPFIAKTPDGKAVTKPYLTDFCNLTYFEYIVVVNLFTQKSDWSKLRDSGYLFFRKASSKSKELLDYIDIIHEKQSL